MKVKKSDTQKNVTLNTSCYNQNQDHDYIRIMKAIAEETNEYNMYREIFENEMKKLEKWIEEVRV